MLYSKMSILDRFRPDSAITLTDTEKSYTAAGESSGSRKRKWKETEYGETEEQADWVHRKEQRCAGEQYP